MKLTTNEIKQLLDLLYLKYNTFSSSSDPNWDLRRFKTKSDIELAAFIVSCYSYGNVASINSFTESIFKYTGKSLTNFIKTTDFTIPPSDTNFYYRFNSNTDFFLLLTALRIAKKEYGSLKNVFLDGYSESHENIIPALTHFSEKLRSFVQSTKSFEYLIPPVTRNSTCKRLNLFLRWMVRKDNIDFGFWGREVSSSKLIIPVDTHVYKVALKIGLVKRKSCDMKFAIELTDRLKQFDAEDPVKYDFALCHIGIDKKVI
ncbi:MAG: TIGR02757 family protein [Ignavibacteria bacterium]|nr:TIGR02757 family protein [Ignavibacteria bacterium]